MISKGDFNSMALSAVMGEVFAKAGDKTLVFSVSDDHSEKYFIFEEEQITLLSLGPRKQALLGDLLVKTKRITEEQLKEALTEQRRTKNYLGNILISRDNTTKDEIDNALREQLFEELFDLITWDRAQYRFEEVDESPTFDDPSVRMTRCEFNPHLLAAKVCQHLEHWELIRSDMDNELNVYTRTDDKAPIEIPEIDDYDRRLLSVIDGYTPLANLPSQAGMSMFRTYLSVDKLQDLQLIEPLPSEEIRDLAETIEHDHPANFEWDLEECADAVEGEEIIADTVGSLNNIFVLTDKAKSEGMQDVMKREDPSGTITVLLDGKHSVRRIIDQTGSPEMDICRVFGRMLRSSLIRPATVTELKESAQELQTEGDLDLALELLQWGKQLDNSDVELIQDLAVVTGAKGNRKLASAYYKEIALLAKQNLDYDLATTALNRVIELAPESYEADSELAAIYLMRGEEFREQALTEFGQALAKLTICGLYEQSKKIVDDILELIPNDEELRSQLLDLSVKIDRSDFQLERHCPSCKAEIEPEDRECSECGTQLFHSCMTCGTDVRIGTFICHSCGKDPYSLPSKSQKGYTLRIKRAEGGAGFVRFKLLDALDKTRKAVSEKRFTQAIESMKEAQRLQPYNEALKTELADIQRLAEEHERGRQKQEEKAASASYRKQFLKRLAIIFAVIAVCISIFGITFMLLFETTEESESFNLLKTTTEDTRSSGGDQLEIENALTKVRAFLSQYPDGEYSDEVKTWEKRLVSHYDKLSSDDYDEIRTLKNVYGAADPQQLVASLGKGEVEKTRKEVEEGIKSIDAFVDKYDMSRHVEELGKLRSELASVRDLLSANSGGDLVEKNALKAFEEAMAAAETEGYPAAVEKLRDLEKKFSGTSAAIQAQQIVQDFSSHIDQYKQAVKQAREAFDSGNFEKAQTILESFEPKEEYVKGTRTAERHRELEREIERERKKFDERVAEVVKSWAEKKLELESYRKRLKKLHSQYRTSGWAYTVQELLEELDANIRRARSCKKRAMEEMEKGDYKESFLWIKRLLDMEHKYVSLADLQFQVKLDSEPSPAEVFIFQGMEPTLIGETPCTVSVPYANGEGASVFMLRKRGFADKRVVITSKEILIENSLNFTFELVSTFSDKWSLARPVSEKPLFLRSSAGDMLAFNQGTGVTFVNVADGSPTNINLVSPQDERPYVNDPTKKTLADDNYWRLKYPLQLETLATPNLSGEYVVAAGSDGRIYCIDPETKKLSYSFGLEHKYNIYGGIVFRRLELVLGNQFAFFAANNGFIYGYDLNSNEIRWKHDTGNLHFIELIGGENYLYARLSNGTLLVMDYGGNASDGSGKVVAKVSADAMKYREGLLYTLDGGRVKVFDTTPEFKHSRTYDLDLDISAQLAVTGDKVVAFDRKSGKVGAFESGFKLWERDFGRPIVSAPVQEDRWMVFALFDGTVLVVQPEKGELVRTLPTKYKWTGRIQMRGNLVILWDVDNTLVILELTSSREIWKNKDISDKILDLHINGNSAVVVTSSHIYIFERVFKDDL
ncbi:MAG: zinc ribbon domain-containing protein [Planctomycetota bacterium]|nr:zinc ribbon domain-containing protein [Planctomycetota bacterium]